MKQVWILAHGDSAQYHIFEGAFSSEEKAKEAADHTVVLTDCTVSDWRAYEQVGARMGAQTRTIERRVFGGYAVTQWVFPTQLDLLDDYPGGE